MQQIFNRKFFIFFGSIIFAEFFTLNVIADEVKIETEKSEEIKSEEIEKEKSEEIKLENLSRELDEVTQKFQNVIEESKIENLSEEERFHLDFIKKSFKYNNQSIQYYLNRN